MKKTKIDWCDCTVNPFVGCKHNCPYCYARKMNQRFKWIPDFSSPQFFPERLKLLDTKTPMSIFMNSMSDILFWSSDKKAVCEIAKSMELNPQHNYIFLTKGRCSFHPFQDGQCYMNPGYNEIPNIFNGLSVDKQDRLVGADDVYDFLSIEPILERVNLRFDMPHVRQVIIGAETGNRKGKIVPLPEWIRTLTAQCDALGIRVFMKESLRVLMGEEFRQDILIWYNSI